MKTELKLPASLILPLRAELSQQELLAELNVSRQTLYNYQRRGLIPSRYGGNRKYYSVATICQFLRANGTDVRLV